MKLKCKCGIILWTPALYTGFSVPWPWIVPEIGKKVVILNAKLKNVIIIYYLLFYLFIIYSLIFKLFFV